MPAAGKFSGAKSKHRVSICRITVFKFKPELYIATAAVAVRTRRKVGIAVALV
jgi:hypothetical protein